jgi:hypothetical protein
MQAHLGATPLYPQPDASRAAAAAAAHGRTPLFAAAAAAAVAGDSLAVAVGAAAGIFSGVSGARPHQADRALLRTAGRRCGPLLAESRGHSVRSLIACACWSRCLRFACIC